ncbi:MAG: twin-arginine translocation signal domain-containing protein, partial [Halalkalicoccus sp.]|nr:twin-arginine translocation signal domain-containing protein [Halalkalicoccus sp.]
MRGIVTRRGFLQTVGTTATGIGLIGTANASSDSIGAGTRYAAFNVIELETEQVQQPGDEQAEAAARIIQRIRPDVLVINELTNNVQQGRSAETSNIDAFVENYLSVPQCDH